MGSSKGGIVVFRMTSIGRIVVFCLGFAGLPGFVLAAKPLPKLAIMPLQAKRVDAETVKVLDDLLVALIDQKGKFDILSYADMENLIGFDAMRKMVGCDTDSCMVELGGALGVTYLLSGNVGRIGEQMMIGLTLSNPEEARTLGRSQKIIENDEALLVDALKEVAKTLMREAGLTLGSSSQESAPASEIHAETPEPSPALEWALAGFGAASLGVGGYFGWRFEESRKLALQPEKEGSQAAIEKARVAQQRAWIGYGVGSGLLVSAGLVWFFSDSGPAKDAEDTSPLAIRSLTFVPHPEDGRWSIVAGGTF